MSLRKLIAKQLAKRARKKINYWSSKPIETQQKVLKQLIEKAKHTAFGKDHNLDQIQSHLTLFWFLQLCHKSLVSG